MRILAIETSTSTGSIAVSDSGCLLNQTVLPAGQRTASLLAPTIADVLKSAGWQPGDIQLLCVTVGPGSFTGLRIAVTTAKTLAYATGAELIGVGTLEVIAAQAPQQHETICPILDAGRGQLYAAKYGRLDADRLETLLPPRIIDAARWLDSLCQSDSVTGLGLKRIAARLPPNVTVVEQEQWLPQAETTARLGDHKYQAGHRDDFWKLAPLYLRQSAAEEKLAANKPVQ